MPTNKTFEIWPVEKLERSTRDAGGRRAHIRTNQNGEAGSRDMKSRTSRGQILVGHRDLEGLCPALSERWTELRIRDMTILKVFKPEELDIAAAVDAIYHLLLEPSPEPPRP